MNKTTSGEGTDRIGENIGIKFSKDIITSFKQLSKRFLQVEIKLMCFDFCTANFFASRKEYSQSLS